MPTKNTKKQQQKILSQAAQKRLELERQEAAKSKVEKLAESIKRRSTVIAKHNSVTTQINAVKKRNTPVKTIKVAAIEKTKTQAPIKRDSEHDIFQARIAERDKQHHRLIKQAETIRNRLDKISKRETTKLYEALRDCYGMYEYIESNREPYEFYSILRDYYKVKMEPIQSNTPDESLLVRFIFSNKSTKQISEYGTVLRYALEIGVAKKDFIKWYTSTTQTRILALARKSATSDNQERLKRARIALLRYFDIQEQWPLGHFDYPELLAAKQVHLPDDLIIVICRGVRKFNRDIEFNPNNPAASRVPLAEISALHFIPPVVDVAHDMIERLARFLVPQIDRIEEEIKQKTEQVWANDLTNYLMERELGTAYKSTDRWADSQQAAIADDQIAFEAKRRKIQKLRNKARK